jgi:tetratricopeptide (TPR) repeat protein
LISVFVDAGYLSTRADKETIVLMARGLASAITAWDRVVGHASGLLHHQDFKSVAARYLRLAAIDFAIRAAALDLLLAFPSPPSILDDSSSAVPAWARSGGVRKKLRELPKSLGRTRAALPSSKRFDEVFDGRNRASIAKLQQFAAIVAALDKTRAPTASWRLHLLWASALDALCNKLEKAVEREVIEEIAAGFRRIRSTTRDHLREAQVNALDQARTRDALTQIVVAGAKAPDSGLFDKLVRAEARWNETANAVAALSNGSVPDDDVNRELTQRAAWARAVRACRADWLLSEVSERFSGGPVPVDGLSIDITQRLVNALRSDAAPDELFKVVSEHPESMLWASRVAVQRAFIRGKFETVLPMVSAFAEAVREPAMYYEAAIIHASAGRIDSALTYLAATGTTEPFATLAQPLAAVLRALSGEHKAALQELDTLGDEDRSLAYARGVALRGLGRARDALRVFEGILADVPKHALALEEATKCCDELAASTHGAAQARWTTRGNRHAKVAAQLGRPVGLTRRDRTHGHGRTRHR